MSTCETCDNPTRDDAYACDGCIDHFHRALGNVAWIDAELETTIAKQKSARAGNTSASPERALPIFLPAVEKRTELRSALVTIVRFCDEEGVRHQSPSNDLPSDDLIVMSRWLMWRCDGLALVDMGPEFMKAVIVAVRACERVIDLPPDRAYAGPCHECSRDLYHRPGAVQVKCAGCGSTWDRRELMEWMRGQVEDRLVTASEGATLLGRFGLETSLRVIYGWAERNRLVQHGDRDGRAVYRFSDLIDLATKRSA